MMLASCDHSLHTLCSLQCVPVCVTLLVCPGRMALPSCSLRLFHLPHCPCVPGLSHNGHCRQENTRFAMLSHMQLCPSSRWQYAKVSFPDHCRRNLGTRLNCLVTVAILIQLILILVSKKTGCELSLSLLFHPGLLIGYLQPAMLFVFYLCCVSPVLKTLTESISTDTIWAMTVCA